MLKMMAATASTLSLALPASVFGQAADFWSLPRSLWLHRASTGETVREVYWYDGKLHEPGYNALCMLLRDVSASKAVTMDVRLLDILRGVQGWLEVNNVPRPLVTTSGYRTPYTNSHTEGASQNSQHPRAKAWDGRIEGVNGLSLAQFGGYLSGGGVGFYQSRGLVHLDSGPLRSWRGR